MTTRDLRNHLDKQTVPNASAVIGGNGEPLFNAPMARRQRSIVANIPDDAIVSREDGTLSIGRFIMAGYGLEVPDDASLDEFEKAFTVMFKVSDQIGLWIGDALAEFERLEHGSVDAIAAYFGVANGTARNWKSRSVRVKLSRRRDNLASAQTINPEVKQLSPSHYSAIAALDADDQDDLMMKALLEGWTVADMRDAVRVLRQSDSDIVFPPPAVEKRNRIRSQMQDSLNLDMPLTEHMEYIAMYERQIEAHRAIVDRLRHDST